MEEVVISMPAKVISAGILLQFEEKFLIGHPTELTGSTHGWGILKGKRDPGEQLFDAAVREFKEESNVDIKKHIEYGNVHIFPYPFYVYDVSKKKTVYVYWMIDVFGHVHRSPLSCPSLVEGTDKPEIDKYKWVKVDEAIKLVTESQKDLFRKVKQLTSIK